MGYRNHVILATVMFVMIMPYVWVTNQTATPTTILGHGLLLWVLAPLCLAPLEAWLRRRSLRHLWQQIPAYLLALIAASAGMILAFHLITEIPLRALVVPPLLTGLLPVFAGYCFVPVTRSIREAREAALRAQLDRNREALRAFTAQLKPHFLFNSLTAIEDMLDEDPSEAKACLRSLSSLYRELLLASHADTSSLAQELKLVRHYLDVQKHRHQHRLEVSLKVAPGLEETRSAPQGLLLTLVENAVKHGLEQRPEATRIEVRAWEDPDLRLTVSNEAPHSASNAPGTGFGLRSSTERVKLHWGEAASLRAQLRGGWFQVDIHVPRALL